MWRVPSHVYVDMIILRNWLLHHDKHGCRVAIFYILVVLVVPSSFLSQDKVPFSIQSNQLVYIILITLERHPFPRAPRASCPRPSFRIKTKMFPARSESTMTTTKSSWKRISNSRSKRWIRLPRGLVLRIAFKQPSHAMLCLEEERMGSFSPTKIGW